MEPFFGLIKIFGGNFAPRKWAFCEGQLMPIAQNTALFSILGTTYGGDGRTTFALPDFRGRLVMHPGRGNGLSSRRLGEVGGAETNTLTIAQMPGHGHGVNASEEANTTDPSDNYIAATGTNVFSTTTNANMNAESTGITGGGLPLNNVQPFTCLSFIISLDGIYPQRD